MKPSLGTAAVVLIGVGLLGCQTPTQRPALIDGPSVAALPPSMVPDERQTLTGSQSPAVNLSPAGSQASDNWVCASSACDDTFGVYAQLPAELPPALVVLGQSVEPVVPDSAPLMTLGVEVDVAGNSARGGNLTANHFEPAWAGRFANKRELASSPVIETAERHMEILAHLAAGARPALASSAWAVARTVGVHSSQTALKVGGHVAVVMAKVMVIALLHKA
jgi:hypothetical protein